MHYATTSTNSAPTSTKPKLIYRVANRTGRFLGKTISSIDELQKDERVKKMHVKLQTAGQKIDKEVFKYIPALQRLSPGSTRSPTHTRGQGSPSSPAPIVPYDEPYPARAATGNEDNYSNLFGSTNPHAGRTTTVVKGEENPDLFGTTTNTSTYAAPARPYKEQPFSGQAMPMHTAPYPPQALPIHAQPYPVQVVPINTETKNNENNTQENIPMAMPVRRSGKLAQKVQRLLDELQTGYASTHITKAIPVQEQMWHKSV